MGINLAREVKFLVDTWNARLVTDKHRFKLYDGILNVLTYLYKRNYRMALVGSRSRSQLQLYFDLFGIDKFFSVTITREDVDEQKPSAKPILQAAEKLNVSPHDCVMIDDVEDGIEVAKKLGALTIGVTWGFHSYKRISNAKPNFIAETPNELHRINNEKTEVLRTDSAVIFRRALVVAVLLDSGLRVALEPFRRFRCLRVPFR